MYFKATGRTNPKTGRHESYYRLVESYRNESSRVCHRTILNLGFLEDGLEVNHLNKIARLLTDRYKRKISLFETTDNLVRKWTEHLWQRIVDEEKLDITLYHPKNRKIDVHTMKHSNAREVGAEWMSYNTWHELHLDDVLRKEGFTGEEIQLAQTQIISRAVYPASELATTRWIEENSAICELTGYPTDRINKDKLYKGALRLYEVKESLERHLSHRTNELFDIEDKIILYDLTNTYFEGQKRNSKLAKFGRSKEKRNDCRLIVLAMVVNVFGFVKYFSIHEGNFADTSDISQILNNLKVHTGKEPKTIVIDAGIATEENLKTIRSKGYHYLCVSRNKIKDYDYDTNRDEVILTTRSKTDITLKRIRSKDNTNYYLEVNSPTKRLKENSMKSRFEERFELELEKIKAGLTKKKGTKRVDKVNQRLGRVKERYPSVHRNYDIALIPDKESKNITAIDWQKNLTKNEEKEQGLGRYFLRTSLSMENEAELWLTYNTIREIENTFRTLKTDLDLRPVYHKRDDATLAHLHLGILAYWLVNTMRCKLKHRGINHNWKEIVRIGNTQKVITTSGYNAHKHKIKVRKCSEPTKKLKELQAALGIKAKPFKRISLPKDVVHKPPNQKNGNHDQRGFTSSG